MTKKLPKFKTDEEAAEFIENNDISDYIDARYMKRMKFEIVPKDKSMNIRVPEDFLKQIKKIAKKHGMAYQKYVRFVLEKEIQKELS